MPDGSRIAALSVDVISRWEEFAMLRPHWQALAARDPEAGLFLGWDWLAEGFAAHPGRWRVLIVHRGARLVAALPLKSRLHWSRSAAEFQTEYEAGGRLIWSEYTGLICDPAEEAAAIALIGRRLRAMPWMRLSLRYVESEDRARRLLAQFPPEGYSGRLADYRINGGRTDNLICPRVPLPADFDSYLAALPSRNMRAKIRRFRRRDLDSGALRLSQADATDPRADIDRVLALWRAKWAPQKGAETARRVAGNYRDMLLAAHRTGTLYLPMLWRGDRLLGGLGHVIDRATGRAHFILAGRDETADEPGIGVLLHAESIRWAIGQGLRIYDFGHGDEAYKFGFGAEARRVSYLTLRRRSATPARLRLDPGARAAALARILAFIEAQDPARAAAGCRQLMALERAEAAG